MKGNPAKSPVDDNRLAGRLHLLVNTTDTLRHSGIPSAEHLAQTLAFAPQDGFVWLCGQRMMLMQHASFTTMRRELVTALGVDKARELLTRLGRDAGTRDAQKVIQRWPEGNHAALYSAGPHLHMLRGMVNVEAIRFEIDSSQGHFYSEFLWHESFEDDEHISSHGLGDYSACWLGIGYASGYASAITGRQIVFREVECRAMGHSACRVIGKPADRWEDAENDRISPGAQTPYAPTLAEGPLYYYETLDAAGEQSPMVGVSPAFQTAKRLLEKVAPTRATVLLTGESGVGKELFARTLHQASRRHDKPWVALNCATLPENLVESELFGVERGAFTGADRSRPGRFERANGGTLFLDEIGTLSLSAQSKILRALQEGEIERVGGNLPTKVDVRIIAATNADLRAEVAAGRFREDLFYRLNVFPIHLPPLRERREDIPLLANHFLRHFCHLYECPVAGVSTRLANTLLTYGFPGNIRELQNLIERGVIAATAGEALDLQHISLGKGESFTALQGLTNKGRLEATNQPANTTATATAIQESFTAPASANSAHPAESAFHKLQAFITGERDKLGINLGEVEQLLVRLAMDRCNGNITAAAQVLGMSRAQVSYRLKAR
jgi:two-component system response regulator HydG